MLVKFQEKYLYLMGYRDDVSMGECFHYGRYVDKNLGIARTFYLQAARRGEAPAFGQLSILSKEEGRQGEAFYYLGIMNEILKDWEEALAAYQQGAAANHAKSMYKLAQLFKKDRFSQEKCIIKKNQSKVLTGYRKAAGAYSAQALDELIRMSDTHPKAALTLGAMFEQGELGNKKVLSKALFYYKKASRMEDRQAAYRLGQLYHYGKEGLRANAEKAFHYYVIAAQRGYKEALDILEKLPQDFNGDTIWLTLGQLQLEVFNNKPSALLYFKYGADKGNKEAKTRLNQLAEEDSTCAYELGRLYEKDHFSIAYHYYAIGMLKNHLLSTDYLTSLAKSGNPEAQYCLGQDYYHAKKEFDQAIYWCMLASEKEHPKAMEYLAKTNFSVNHYLFLAEKYKQGKDIQKDIKQSLYFYEKAYASGSIVAVFCLGELYYYGEEGLQIDVKKAFNYYLLAAREGHSPSLAALEKLTTVLNENACWLKLGQVQHDVFNKKLSALLSFKYSADQGNESARIKLDQLAEEDSTCAYELGKLYEQSDSSLAYRYYINAILQSHQPSLLDHLIFLAKSGDLDAQCCLGIDYFHAKKEFGSAIYWCMLAAEKQYPKAIAYLTETNFDLKYYLLIAQKYERGEEVKKNIPQALYFYEKALALKSKEAAFRLGQLYQLDSVRNLDKGCEYLIQAAEYGHTDALTPLERLGEELGPRIQLKLGNLFRRAPFNNLAKARHWYQEASEGGSLEARQQLENLNKRFAPTYSSFFYQDASQFNQTGPDSSFHLGSDMNKFFK